MSGGYNDRRLSGATVSEVEALRRERDSARTELRAALHEPDRIALLVSQAIGNHMEPPDSSGCESGDDARAKLRDLVRAIVRVVRRAEDAEAERDDARAKLRALADAASALCRDAAIRGELKDEMRDSWEASMEADERLRAVRKLLEENGCDCPCDHHPDERGPDCEVCLACRIGEAVGK